MTTKVSICRRWTEPIPIGRDGRPIPKNLWPRRRKHVWVVRWFVPGPDGKIVRPSRVFQTREEAEKFRTEQTAAFDRLPQACRKPANVTVGQFAVEFVQLATGPRGQRLKPSSLERARCCLNRLAAFVGDGVLLTDITSSHAVRFLAAVRDGQTAAGIRKKLAPASNNAIKRTLKAAFSVAVSPLGYIRENPFKNIKPDRLADVPIRYVTAEEFAALTATCQELPESQRLWWESFLAICYTAGLRYGEVLHLTWADVDFDGNHIRVSAKKETPATLAWTPKDYETRLLPVPAAVTDLLAKLQATSIEGHAYVFISPERLNLIKVAQAALRWREGKAVINNFGRGFRLLVKQAARNCTTLVDVSGKPTLSVHDLRRSAITNWSRAANMQTVMRLAGHSNVETTQRYYAAATQDQLDKVRAASEAAISVAQSRQTDPKLTPKAKSGLEKGRRSGTKSLSNKMLRP